jgi:hypothetical protein
MSRDSVTVRSLAATGGIVAALAIGLLGCDNPKPTASAAITDPPAAVAPSDCANRIAAVKLDVVATIDAVDACRFTSEGAAAAQAAIASGASGSALWAAVWVYAASGSDPAPLKPLATTSDASVRVMAGAALISFGDATGFDALRQSLTNGDDLEGSAPPIAIGDFAAGSLAQLITGTSLPTTAADWATWLTSNASHLVFDAASGTWAVS